MTVYNYRACDAQGQIQSGMLEADSVKRVRQALRERGLVPLDIQLISQKPKSTQGFFSGLKQRPVSLSQLALFTRELANLLDSGMPVEQALGAAAEQSEFPRLRKTIMGVRDKVLEGYSLGNALAPYPNVFPTVYQATVAAGEHAGHLTDVLLRLADHLDRQITIRHKLQQAMIYPAVMTTVSIAVVFFLLVMVVPQMVGIFKDFDKELPLATRILLGISSGLSRYSVFILLGVIAFVAGFRWLLKKPKFERKLDQYLLRLPVIGDLIILVNTARYCRTLGILFSASVPIEQAMQTAGELVSNLPMRSSVEAATQKVKEGSAIAAALKQSGYFLPLTIHFIANGEASGQLEEMLSRAALQQESRVNRFIDTSLTIFEPLLILIMGGVVLFIVLAILLPMFSMTQLIS